MFTKETSAYYHSTKQAAKDLLSAEPEIVYSPFFQRLVRVLRVGKSLTAEFRTIADAVSASTSGDRIEVEGAEYYESIAIPHALDITGCDAELPHILTRGPCLTISTDEPVMISKLRITGRGAKPQDAVALLIVKGSPIVQDCKLSSVHVTNHASPRITHCSIEFSDNGCGLRLSEYAAGDYLNNEIRYHKEECIRISSTGAPRFSGNRIYQRSGRAWKRDAYASGGRRERDDNAVGVSRGSIVAIAGSRHGENCAPEFRDNIISGSEELSADLQEADNSEIVYEGPMQLFTYDPSVVNALIAVSWGASPLLCENALFHGTVGIHLVDCTIKEGRLHSNRISRCSSWGLYAGKGAKVDIFDNDFLSNGGGIRLQSSEVNLRQCHINGNRQFGLMVYNSSPDVIKCQIDYNQCGVAIVKQCDDLWMSECVIRHNRTCGVEVLKQGSGKLSMCNIHENTLSGILIGERSTLALENSCQLFLNDTNITVRGESSVSCHECRLFEPDGHSLVVMEKSVALLDSNEFCDSGSNAHVAFVKHSSGVVKNNIFRTGPSSGILVETNANPLITGNTFSSLREGIRVRDFGQSTIEQNEIQTCGIALVCELNSHCVFTQNVVRSCTNAFVLSQTGAHPSVRLNDFATSGSLGLSVIEGGNIDFEKNSMRGCADGFVNVSGRFTKAHIGANRIYGSVNSEAFGILVDQGAKATVYRNHLCGPGSFAVGTSTGAGPEVRNNHITGRFDVGIAVSAGGCFEDNLIEETKTACVRLERYSTALLTRNRLTKCEGDGLHVGRSSQAVVEDEEIFMNNGNGVVVQDDSGTELRRIRIHHNTQHGIFVQRQGNCTVQQCVIEDNEGAGIALDSAGEIEFLQCIVKRHRQGVLIENGGKALLEGLEISEILDDGIFTVNGGGIVENCTIRDVGGKGMFLNGPCLLRVKGTVISNCSLYGVLASADAGLVMQRCRIDTCDKAGVKVISGSNSEQSPASGLLKSSLVFSSANPPSPTASAGTHSNSSSVASIRVSESSIVSCSLHGILLACDSAAEFYQMSIIGCRVGITLQSQSMVMVKQTAINNCTTHGIVACGELRHGSTLSGVTVTAVSGVGLLGKQTKNLIVHKCVFTQNSIGGMISRGGQLQVNECQIVDHETFGFWGMEKDRSTLTACILELNRESHVISMSESCIVVQSCTLRSSELGVMLYFGSACVKESILQTNRVAIAAHHVLERLEKPPPLDDNDWSDKYAEGASRRKSTLRSLVRSAQVSYLLGKHSPSVTHNEYVLKFVAKVRGGGLKSSSSISAGTTALAASVSMSSSSPMRQRTSIAPSRPLPMVNRPLLTTGDDDDQFLFGTAFHYDFTSSPKWKGSLEVIRCLLEHNSIGIEAIHSQTTYLIQETKIHNSFSIGLDVHVKTAPQVLNSVVLGAATGVALRQNSSAVILETVFRANSCGLLIEGDSQSTIRKCSFEENLACGVSVTRGAVNPILRGNKFLRNLKRGIDIHGKGTNLLVAWNVFEKEREAVYIHDEANPVFHHNLVRRSTDVGVHVEGASTKPHLVLNHFEGNAIGCRVAARSTAELIKNVFFDNTVAGLSVTFSAAPFVVRNIFEDHPKGASGVVVESSGAGAICYNRFGSNYCGMEIISSTESLVVEDNYFEANKESGAVIRLACAAGLFAKNQFSDNAREDLLVDGTITDAHGAITMMSIYDIMIERNVFSTSTTAVRCIGSLAIHDSPLEIAPPNLLRAVQSRANLKASEPASPLVGASSATAGDPLPPVKTAKLRWNRFHGPGGTGVWTGRGARVHLLENLFSKLQTGICCSANASTIIENCLITSSTGAGVQLQAGSATTIEDCTLSHMHGNAVLTEHGSQTKIMGCRIGQGASGKAVLNLRGSGEITLSLICASANLINAQERCNTLIHRNIIRDSKTALIFSSDSQPLVKSNSIHRSEVGVNIAMGAAGVLQGNSIYSCFRVGIFVHPPMQVSILQNSVTTDMESSVAFAGLTATELAPMSKSNTITGASMKGGAMGLADNVAMGGAEKNLAAIAAISRSVIPKEAVMTQQFAEFLDLLGTPTMDGKSASSVLQSIAMQFGPRHRLRSASGTSTTGRSQPGTGGAIPFQSMKGAQTLSINYTQMVHKLRSTPPQHPPHVHWSEGLAREMICRLDEDLLTGGALYEGTVDFNIRMGLCYPEEGEEGTLTMQAIDCSIQQAVWNLRRGPWNEGVDEVVMMEATPSATKPGKGGDTAERRGSSWAPEDLSEGEPEEEEEESFWGAGRVPETNPPVIAPVAAEEPKSSKVRKLTMIDDDVSSPSSNRRRSTVASTATPISTKKVDTPPIVPSLEKSTRSSKKTKQGTSPRKKKGGGKGSKKEARSEMEETSSSTVPNRGAVTDEDDEEPQRNPEPLVLIDSPSDIPVAAHQDPSVVVVADVDDGDDKPHKDDDDVMSLNSEQDHHQALLQNESSSLQAVPSGTSGPKESHESDDQMALPKVLASMCQSDSLARVEDHPPPPRAAPAPSLLPQEKSPSLSHEPDLPTPAPAGVLLSVLSPASGKMFTPEPSKAVLSENPPPSLTLPAASAGKPKPPPAPKQPVKPSSAKSVPTLPLASKNASPAQPAVAPPSAKKAKSMIKPTTAAHRSSLKPASPPRATSSGSINSRKVSPVQPSIHLSYETAVVTTSTPLQDMILPDAVAPTAVMFPPESIPSSSEDVSAASETPRSARESSQGAREGRDERTNPQMLDMPFLIAADGSPELESATVAQNPENSPKRSHSADFSANKASTPTNRPRREKSTVQVYVHGEESTSGLHQLHHKKDEPKRTGARASIASVVWQDSRGNFSRGTLDSSFTDPPPSATSPKHFQHEWSSSFSVPRGVSDKEPATTTSKWPDYKSVLSSSFAASARVAFPQFRRPRAVTPEDHLGPVQLAPLEKSDRNNKSSSLALSRSDDHNSSGSHPGEDRQMTAVEMLYLRLRTGTLLSECIPPPPPVAQEPTEVEVRRPSYGALLTVLPRAESSFTPSDLRTPSSEYSDPPLYAHHSFGTSVASYPNFRGGIATDTSQAGVWDSPLPNELSGPNEEDDADVAIPYESSIAVSQPPIINIEGHTPAPDPITVPSAATTVAPQLPAVSRPHSRASAPPPPHAAASTAGVPSSSSSLHRTEMPSLWSHLTTAPQTAATTMPPKNGSPPRSLHTPRPQRTKVVTRLAPEKADVMTRRSFSVVRRDDPLMAVGAFSSVSQQPSQQQQQVAATTTTTTTRLPLLASPPTSEKPPSSHSARGPPRPVYVKSAKSHPRIQSLPTSHTTAVEEESKLQQPPAFDVASPSTTSPYIVQQHRPLIAPTVLNDW